MDILGETAKKIRSLEIQGATSIAIAATKAFAEVLRQTKNEKEILHAAEILKAARPTEPALRNSLRYCLLKFKKNPKNALTVADEVLHHFKTSKEKMVAYGSEKIQVGMTVFTHCHSSTVTDILITAWNHGKRFTVRNTETRPKYQGRKTAEELAAAGIPVIHSVDSAGRLGMKKADMFLFGADSITAEGNVINKIGTALFCEFANLYQIPVYSASDSWKFSPETLRGIDETIEERDAKEVWENPPSGVFIENPAFETTSADRITGIITELGILKPETLIIEVKKAYPWIIQ